MGCGGNQTGSPSPGVSGGEETVSRPRELMVRLKSRASGEALAGSWGAEIKADFYLGKNHYLQLYFPQGNFADKTREVKSSAQVIFCEPNYLYRPDLTPNDPSYPYDQYAPQLMKAPAAWDISTGSAQVTVGVIDTGIDGQHPDLAGQLVSGWDFINQRAYPPDANYDQQGHGSHVAGIIGAVGNNGVGITGVNWTCSLLPLKVFGAGGGAVSDLAQAVLWATDNQARVINMSLGGKSYSQTYADAINYALAHNVTVVASMGNDGKTSVNYPAAYQGVIAVGSTTAQDNISSFSTRGPHISVCSPGSQIYSTYNDDAYRTLSGTSMAAPQVAGACALLLSLRPVLTPQEIKTQLEETADDLGAPGFDETYGWGRINLQRLMGALQSNRYGSAEVSVAYQGAALEGAEVVIFNQEGEQIASTLTDEDGLADFYLLRAGDYTVRLGYLSQSYSQALNLSAGATAQIAFEL